MVLLKSQQHQTQTASLIFMPFKPDNYYAQPVESMPIKYAVKVEQDHQQRRPHDWLKTFNA